MKLCQNLDGHSDLEICHRFFPWFKEKGDQKSYTHEFKLEPGESITDITAKSVEGVGVYSLVFKTTQGRQSETFEGWVHFLQFV